jgi:hypothetical protein
VRNDKSFRRSHFEMLPHVALPLHCADKKRQAFGKARVVAADVFADAPLEKAQ